MAKTIVGVFDDAFSAQNVVRELEDAGIPRRHIRLASNSDASPVDAHEAQAGWADRILAFFETLFEDVSDRDHAHNYAEAWRRGHLLVVADVESAQLETTVEIMNRYGTVDLDRRVAQWKSSGYSGTYDQTAPPYTSEQRTRELASYQTERHLAVRLPSEEAIGRQIARRGGVRVHSYRDDDQTSEDTIRVREQRVVDERPPG